MKNMVRVVSLSLGMMMGASAIADSNQAAPKSDAEKAGTRVVTQAGRIAAGAVVGAKVGETAGTVVRGSPIGAALGMIFSPTEIGCGKGEDCVRR